MGDSLLVSSRPYCFTEIVSGITVYRLLVVALGFDLECDLNCDSTLDLGFRVGKGFTCAA